MLIMILILKLLITILIGLTQELNLPVAFPPCEKSNSPSLADVVSGESERKEDKKGSTWKKSESGGLDSLKSTSIPLNCVLGQKGYDGPDLGRIELNKEDCD